MAVLWLLLHLLRFFILCKAVIFLPRSETKEQANVAVTIEEIDEEEPDVLPINSCLNLNITTADDGNCSANNHNAPNDDDDDDEKEIPCDLYGYDYWIFAGREFMRNERLSWSHDPTIVFHQQSRRAFPRWNRYHHFRQVENSPYEFIVAPGLAEWPLECHPRLYNLRSNATKTGATLMTDRSILPGEAILAECIIDERRTGTYTIDTIPYFDLDFLKEHATCLDTVTYQPPEHWRLQRQQPQQQQQQQLTNKFIVTAKRPLQSNSLICMGQAVHMHRAEFWNSTTQSNTEPLISYTYGHEQSDLLLLPFAPIFASIATTSNVSLVNAKLHFDMDGDIANYLIRPTRFQFGEYEQAQLWVKMLATRDISVGETIYVYSSPTVGGERPVPEDFFPKAWLQREKRATLDPITHEFQFDTLDLTKLPPGTVHPATVTATQLPLGRYLHRVGLPSHLVPTMKEWGETLGVVDHLKRYVFDKTLEKDAHERIIFRNGTWWARRFDNSWQSNMHYVAVDDDESNEQFFQALYRGGFDTVLQGVGEYFNLTQLTCFYPTFIIVSHCVQSMMHSDSDFPTVFNMIFPITQVLDGEAELVLGADTNSGNPLHIPYVYERDHGILVGHGGMHGTSPTDYRNGKEESSYRIVMSVYMGDFSNDAMRQKYIAEYEDPPYANYWPGQLDHTLSERIHWKRNDPSKSIGGPMPRKFPKERPPPMGTRRSRRRRYDVVVNNNNNKVVAEEEVDAAVTNGGGTDNEFYYSDDDEIVDYDEDS